MLRKQQLTDVKLIAYADDLMAVEESVELTIGECDVTLQPQLKYLGVISNFNLKVKEQRAYISGKANKIYNALWRIMANRSCERSSRFLNIATIWIQAMDMYKSVC
uniref:Reverse transcriptase domain-containing protein n=1 Tax=Bactrocera dorsalis TaxID=27457 RepID=A0A034V929_BACDO